MEAKTVTVSNISCEHCVHTIESEVSEIQGVSEVKADQQTKQVTIHWDKPASWLKIAEVLTEIDYPADA